MADVLLIIALRQFWNRGLFFGTHALLKNRRAYVDNQNWQQLEVTGLTNRADWSDQCKQSPNVIKLIHVF